MRSPRVLNNNGLRHRPARLTRTALALALPCLAIGLGVSPAAASAEPLCSDTWTGPSEGEWQTPGDWSKKTVPKSSDIACIGSGKTVTVTATAQSGVVQGEGTVVLSSSTLTVSNSGEPSVIGSLTVSGGTLAGAATVEVTSALNWTAGQMTGAGTTVIGSKASGTIYAATGYVTASEGHTIVNNGTTTLSGGVGLSLANGSILSNVGTFVASSTAETELGFSGSGATVRNTGLFEKTGGATVGKVEPTFENKGTTKVATGSLALTRGGYSTGELTTSEGAAFIFNNGTFSIESGSVTGAVMVNGATVLATKVVPHLTSLSISGGTLNIEAAASWTTPTLSISGGTLTGGGSLEATSSFTWTAGELVGAGTTINGAKSGAILTTSGALFSSEGHKLINHGVMTIAGSGGLSLVGAEASFYNDGTVDVTSTSGFAVGFLTARGSMTNAGILEKSVGTQTAKIEPFFTNYGRIEEHTGSFNIEFPVATVSASSTFGGSASIEPGQICSCSEDPVLLATGDLLETQTDLTVGGRGVPLDLTRTYNSQAAMAGIKGIFGYGWSSSFEDGLVVDKEHHTAAVHRADGGTIVFTESGGLFKAPATSRYKLSGSTEAGYTLTAPDQTTYKFSGGTGRLESVTDRNNNITTLAYGGTGHLETITDATGRKMTLAYNAKGLVETAKDPLGHTVTYTYEGENLAGVTLPGEAKERELETRKERWSFKYDASHQLTELIDGHGDATINTYNAAHQVETQTDPLKHVTEFAYKPFDTRMTHKATGAVTDEQFTSANEPSTITRGYETAQTTTETFSYNEGGYQTSRTDGNGHTTKYGYDGESNRTSMVDPETEETKWGYNSTHDVTSTTTPKGETTTIKRDAHGNAESISRPAPGGKTQITTYKYTTHGELESTTDSLEHTWKYEYDGHGNRTAEIDPESDKRTWTYDQDSRESTMVSPDGHVVGAKETKFTTTLKRDEQGRPTLVTAPLKHETSYTYDANGNLKTETDPEANKTEYTYNADNQPIKVEEPNKTITEAEYDGAGQVISQTDGNKHVTKYKRNVLEQVVEVEDPFKRKTTKEYDAAGNLKALTDPASRTTSYACDAANRLKKITYSDGKTPTVEYEYDKDGNRTKMIDGTGTSTYEYDQLDRLTATKDGHGDTDSYEYNLANEQTKITYPNGKAVTRAFDNTGRLKTVEDWLEHTTKFVYDADSNLKTTTFPTGTSNEDTYEYDESDAMSEVKMSKGAEVLASLVYTRNKDGGVTKATTKGLPGEEKPAFAYDENSRLSKGAGTTYKYDNANNPTTIGTETYAYDAASELESRILKKATTATYTYDELGERTKTTPTTGPATTYAYDEAGNLTAVTRPKEGATAAIEDSYGYDGSGLRASQTITGATTYLAWDLAEGLPNILTDGTNSFIYGPGGLPVEQIASAGTITYLHHDQQGSTRLLTASTGTVTGSTTFDAYGNNTGSTGTTTTPLGYDAQYTSSDTGLIYLRARSYDPATSQFLSQDPITPISRAPYAYASDEPLSLGDPTGLIFGIPGTPSVDEVGQFVKEQWRPVVSATLNVATIAGCAVPLTAGGCAAYIGANALAQSALIATGPGSFEKRAALVAANLVLAGGASLAASQSDLIANLVEINPAYEPPAWVAPYLAGAAAVPSLALTSAEFAAALRCEL
jgi:RHS repeat-associated protein